MRYSYATQPCWIEPPFVLGSITVSSLRRFDDDEVREEVTGVISTWRNVSAVFGGFGIKLDLVAVLDTEVFTVVLTTVDTEIFPFSSDW